MGKKKKLIPRKQWDKEEEQRFALIREFLVAKRVEIEQDKENEIQETENCVQLILAVRERVNVRPGGVTRS